MKEVSLSNDLVKEKHEETKTVLFSKLSVFLISILISPLLGGFIYCANLRHSNQKEKIFGTYIALVLCNFLSLAPFLGFDVDAVFFNLILLINRIIVALLLIFPMWKIHFDEIEYEVTFPFVRYAIMIIIYEIVIYYHYWLAINFTFYNPSPIYFIRFTSLTPLPLLIITLLGRLLYLLIKMILKETKRRITTYNKQ